MLMAASSTSLAGTTVEQLAQEPQVARALARIHSSLDWITEQQIRLTEIPAPPFHEAARAAAMREALEKVGLKAKIDRAGNVVAERPGADRERVVLVCAHLDTVFPPGTDVHVRREQGHLRAPGIADNGAGLAALVAVARALEEARVRTRQGIVFAADVGEEGEGNLRGMRELVSTYGKRLRGVIAIDGFSADHVTTMALASRRIEVTIAGPGGHSWSDFGAPNPIQALARGIVRFAGTPLPSGARSSFNFGVIEGGASVNAIPSRASVKVDLRSESDAALAQLDQGLRAAMAGGLQQEMAAARAGSKELELSFRILGERPAGELPANAPLLEAVREVDRYLGQRSRLERSSTDANIPLSRGIPAIAIGGGGQGGGAHSLDEWYDPAGREFGLKRLLLLLVSVAGTAR
jgi:tripeptide aminopeptidase